MLGSTAGWKYNWEEKMNNQNAKFRVSCLENDDVYLHHFLSIIFIIYQLMGQRYYSLKTLEVLSWDPALAM